MHVESGSPSSPLPLCAGGTTTGLTDLNVRDEKSDPKFLRLFSVVRGEDVGAWPSLVGRAEVRRSISATMTATRGE